jgi:hypothetical protein
VREACNITVAGCESSLLLVWIINVRDRLGHPLFNVSMRRDLGYTAEVGCNISITGTPSVKGRFEGPLGKPQVSVIDLRSSN